MDMRELSTLGFWAPRSRDLPKWAKDRFPYTSPGFHSSKPGGVELFFTTSTSRHSNYLNLIFDVRSEYSLNNSVAPKFRRFSLFICANRVRQRGQNN